MAKKGTEITVGKEGFSFKTDGEASERLANAALDFLSPVTEGAGFLGTKLRGYRMEAALKATIRAKQICEENNLPINPVPPKFLLQWVEGASIENPEDETLINLWSNLLASESSNPSTGNLTFIRIIKELTREEAKCLVELANLNGDYPEALEDANDYAENFMSSKTDQDKFLVKKISPDTIYSEMLETYDIPGLCLHNLSVSKGRYKEYPYDAVAETEYKQQITSKYRTISFDILEGLNLIKSKSFEIGVPKSKLVVWGQFYYFTPLGAAFYCSCISNSKRKSTY